MQALTRILSATDFSVDARHGTERAAVLCAASSSTAGRVLHVVEPAWTELLQKWFGSGGDAVERRKQEAERALAEQVAMIRQKWGVDLVAAIASGRPIDEIIAACAGADLLVLGARGSHPIRALALGTTSERLLCRTPIPVLVVRRPVRRAYRRVLCTVDFSPSSTGSLALSRAIAREGRVYVAHVVQAFAEREMHFAGVSEVDIDVWRARARSEAAVQMSTLLTEAGVAPSDVHPWIDEGSHVGAKVVAMAREIRADLVVVGRHGASLSERLLLGSVTLHVLAGARCDVLVAT